MRSTLPPGTSGTRTPVQDRALPVLVAGGTLAPTAAESARAEPGGPSALYRLVASGAVSPADAAEALRAALGWPAVDLAERSPDPGVCALLPADEAASLPLALLALDGRELLVAVADPYDREVLDRARRVAQDAGGCTVRSLVADEHSLERFVERAYREESGRLHARAERALAAVRGAAPDATATALDEAVSSAEIPSLVSGLLEAAVAQGASDVHVEWYEDGGRVRFRKDGALGTVMRLDGRLAAGMAVHLKHRARMDNTRSHVPADGAFKVTVRRQTLGIRVSSLPTLFGEKLVLRILGAGKLARLGDLGIPPRELMLIRDAIHRPNRMVLVTGPTGSGKTTTLYAMLDEINTEARNIVSAEDPPERVLRGVNQVEVQEHESRHLNRSYEVVLRSMLRQDPNVLMIGEIRDAATGRTAVRASMTGHLVLSTLHTMDGPETVARLADLGIERFNIVGSLRLVVSQRLVPELCPGCRVPDRPDELTVLASGLSEAEVRALDPQRSTGCEHCRHTGVVGRFGLYEVMRMTPGVARLVVAGAGAEEIRAAAQDEDGMVPLRTSGLRAVAAGRARLDAALAEINS